EDGLIDWKKSPKVLYNWIRGQTHPFPGAFSHILGRKIYIWKSKLPDGKQKGNSDNSRAGEILSIVSGEGITANTGNGSLLLLRLSFENEAEMWADDFAKVHKLKSGDIFG
ncbi:MAG: hypothetical protein AABY04_01200, partial [Candidatus Micrarchaeota archaeon]